MQLSGIYEAHSVAVSAGQTPAGISSVISIPPLSPVYLFRLTAALLNRFKSTLVGVIFMSQASRSVNGNPRVQFHLNRRFPAGKI